MRERTPINLNEFILYLTNENPELLTNCGIAAALDAISKAVIVEEFQRWRKNRATIAAANPTIAGPEAG